MYKLIEKLGRLSLVNTVASDWCMDYYYHKVAKALNLQIGRKRSGRRKTEKEGKKEKTKGIWRDKHRWREVELEPQVRKKNILSPLLKVILSCQLKINVYFPTDINFL